MGDERAIRIEVEWDNGKLMRAEGSDAAKIWDAIQGGFVMLQIHGMNYTGPQMKVIRPSLADSPAPSPAEAKDERSQP